jgi:hypothetical protein
MLGYLALEQALAKRIGPGQAALPPFSLGDADTLRSLVTSAGFRAVRLRIDAKMIRVQSAEHMVRAMVGSAPIMLGALAAQRRARHCRRRGQRGHLRIRGRRRVGDPSGQPHRHRQCLTGSRLPQLPVQRGLVAI